MPAPRLPADGKPQKLPPAKAPPPRLTVPDEEMPQARSAPASIVPVHGHVSDRIAEGFQRDTVSTVHPSSSASSAPPEQMDAVSMALTEMGLPLSLRHFHREVLDRATPARSLVPGMSTRDAFSLGEYPRGCKGDYYMFYNAESEESIIRCYLNPENWTDAHPELKDAPMRWDKRGREGHLSRTVAYICRHTSARGDHSLVPLVTLLDRKQMHFF